MLSERRSSGSGRQQLPVLGQNDCIDGVNGAIRRDEIRLRDAGPIDPHVRGRYRCRQRAALHCHHFARLHVLGHKIAPDDVIVQNCLELRRVLAQEVIRAGRKLLERFVGRRKDRERALRGQLFGQPRCLNAGSEGREIARSDRRIDDVLCGCCIVVPGGIVSRNAL